MPVPLTRKCRGGDEALLRRLGDSWVHSTI